MCSSDTQELFKIAEYCKIVLKTFQEIFRNIKVFVTPFSIDLTGIIWISQPL